MRQKFEKKVRLVAEVKSWMLRVLAGVISFAFFFFGIARAAPSVRGRRWAREVHDLRDAVCGGARYLI